MQWKQKNLRFFCFHCIPIGQYQLSPFRRKFGMTHKSSKRRKDFMALSPGTTLADYLVPARVTRSNTLLRDGILVVGFSIFLALCAQVSFHIPFTPVPITLQTLAVVLTGAALG